MSEKNLRIIIVEDNKDDFVLLKKYLKDVCKKPCELKHVETMTDAVKTLGSGDFDIILLDLGLPDSDGLETLKKIQAIEKKIPIVVFSGLNDESIAVQSVKEGAQDYLIKGATDGNQLKRTIRYAIERHKAQIEAEKIKKELILLIGHDLKNPIISMMGLADLITEDNLGTIPQNKIEFAKLIINSGEMAIDLIHNITESLALDTSLLNYYFQDFPLNKIILNVIKSVDFWAKRKEISVLYTCPEDLYVKADRFRLQQVFHNLLSNALQNTKEKGTINITCQLKGDRIFISVSDTGCGIPKENQKLIFEKFNKIKTKTKGSGLGLYIVKRILEAHGSDITIESNVDKGACFSFNLPKGKKTKKRMGFD